MPKISDEQLSEISDDQLIEKNLIIRHKKSVRAFEFIELRGHGDAGVVWKAKDDLVGGDVAIKIVPEDHYKGKSLIDEMTEAAKLSSELFAKIEFFGNLEIENVPLKSNYIGIATEWVNGVQWDEYAKNEISSVDELLLLSSQLFGALNILKENNLCHDDLHPGNVMISKKRIPLGGGDICSLKIIDTGTLKRLQTREHLQKNLEDDISKYEKLICEDGNGDNTSILDKISELKNILKWFKPGDHLRTIECLLIAANGLNRKYHRLDVWERKFLDELLPIINSMIDEDLSRRLDEPERVIQAINNLARDSKTSGWGHNTNLASPFDYISAEMITNDMQFTELFSLECPWLNECRGLEPLYIYGPRGCGKSSVLRWLSYKTILLDKQRNRNLENENEIGIYISCSVELRSRFWLLGEASIEELQSLIIQYFNLLLLEELFDTMRAMYEEENAGKYYFGIDRSDHTQFAAWLHRQITPDKDFVKFQGQNVFNYLKGYTRGQRWDVWSRIQRREFNNVLPNPALVSDVCRELPSYYPFFRDKCITFLIDDYSNQRIPPYLQKKLNKTISFAKQGTPLFKVSSEYLGVELEDIEEGREVRELNIGEKYINLADENGYKFLEDIINLRLIASEYIAGIKEIIGETPYTNMAKEILEQKENGKPFYYCGLQCIHQLCSGDVALALDLVKRIFDDGNITKKTNTMVPVDVQHKAIQRFSHNEVRRIRHLVPFGEEMYNIICHLGAISRAFVLNKKSQREDRKGDPSCRNHLDVRNEAVEALKQENDELLKQYESLKSRSILISLDTSRSRISGSTERLQMKRIYYPSFIAPIKRDAPIKIDDKEDLKSLLTNTRTFAERELDKSSIPRNQLELALRDSLARPKEI
jgi:serine/threonine protein kinase